jgi:glycerophosphoryl diester phosphodiesterase
MSPVLIHHAAHAAHPFPASSMSGLRACAASGAAVVEVDITPLAGGDFLLAHIGNLDEVSTGQGFAHQNTRADLIELRYVELSPDGPVVSDEPLATLSEALELLIASPFRELQLDLKPDAPLDAAHIRLLSSLPPHVMSRVRVSSTADWFLWPLREAAPALPMGFDPLLYLDFHPLWKGPRATPPRQAGAFGYWDEHPLALRQWGLPADYLALRFAALARQVPPGCVWYLRATLVARCLSDGFSPIDFLHSLGSEVAAWTLHPADLPLVRSLLAAGVDRITTDEVADLAALL